jgi:hypothetical protein
MAKVTAYFGSVLILLGLAYFAFTGHVHPTSLIPAGVGILLVIFGWLAKTENPKRRMLFMHIAVTIGLLGFLGTGWSIVKVAGELMGQTIVRPIAEQEKAAMAGLLLIFVVLCVRSFVAARRVRV